MNDRFMKQLEGILSASDREELEALYTEALRIEDYRQAHDLLLKLIILLLGSSSEKMSNMVEQQQMIARHVKALEKRVDSFVNPA
ncbi:hypothetical protein ES703_72226 [subsurface metagenome]